MTFPNASNQEGRVGLFFSSLRGAGIQRVMLNLAEGFLAHGLQVDLIIVNAKGELASAVPDGIKIFDLKSNHSMYTLPQLVKYLRDQRPTALLASQTHLNLLAIFARILSRTPTRLILSEHIALDAATKNAANWKELFFPLGARLFYRMADGIIVVSKEAAERFLKITGLPRNLVKVIYNPIVTSGLLTQMQNNPDHPWLQPNQLPVIISVGRLTRQKDHITLLHAFAILRQKISARLIILGEGEERFNLEKLSQKLGIQNDISMPGFAPNPFAYMACSRVFVLSSRWEGFGNVLVEALVCGIPVVSTDCPSGPSEILENGKYGALTPVGDPLALADAILKTLDHPHPSNILRQRAMDFSMENIIPQYLDILQPASSRTLNLP